MKTVITLLVVLSMSSAFAEQFKTVTKDYSSKNYDSTFKYPVLLQNSVAKAADKINKNFLQSLIDKGCGGDEEPTAEISFNYDISSRIVALNASYVGYEVSYDDYCGGAHPNNGTYNVTYNAVSGEEINMDQEVPVQSYDNISNPNGSFDKYQEELAKIMYANLKTATLDMTDESSLEDCLGLKDGKKAVIDQLVTMFPMISGLAKNKEVIIRTYPAHVMAICGLSVRVPFSKVEKYFKKDSVVRPWLK